MKKIALALVAVATLGLAACNGNETADTNAVDTNTESTIKDLFGKVQDNLRGHKPDQRPDQRPDVP